MGKLGVRIKWLAVTSFEIEANGFTVVTDPYITECVGTDLDYTAVENCDAICLSHAHWDHITDIPRLCEKFKPIVLCGDKTALPLAKWIDYNPSFVYPMYPDTELDFGAMKIKALYGRHTNLKKTINQLNEVLATRDLCIKDPGMNDLQEIGSFEYRNYLFTLPNGVKILLWGNEPTVEQVNICKALKPDIAIIQRSVALDATAKKAEFVKEIGAKILIPHHHDFKQVDDSSVVENFKKEFLARVPDGAFIAPKHGEWIEL